VAHATVLSVWQLLQEFRILSRFRGGNEAEGGGVVCVLFRATGPLGSARGIEDKSSSWASPGGRCWPSREHRDN